MMKKFVRRGLALTASAGLATMLGGCALYPPPPPPGYDMPRAYDNVPPPNSPPPNVPADTGYNSPPPGPPPGQPAYAPGLCWVPAHYNRWGYWVPGRYRRCY